MSDKAVITCALNGVLTDPKQHNVPVTPEQMAREAKAAFDAGASVMHIHLRQQAPGKGHLPSWEVGVSRDIQQAIRDACPGVIINHTTGIPGPSYLGALACVRETSPSRSPSFANLQALPEICRGELVSDLVALIGTLDVALGEVDR